MAKGGHSHRSTQKNDHKPFKSKHASKGQLKNQHKGKVEKSSGAGQKIKVITKVERKNLSKQSRENKILESKITRKLFEGSQGAEKIITVIGLTKDLDASEIAQTLVGPVSEDPNEIIPEFTTPSVNNVKVGRFKSNLKIIIPDHNDILAVLDAAKVSDFVVFGVSATEEVDKEFGEQILRALTAQGIASVIGVLPNVVSAYPKRNLQLDIRQSLQSFFNHFFPHEEKLYALEAESERANCLRTICQKYPKSIKWRDARGYLVADNASWSSEGEGSVVIEGTVRGTGFSANRLVHIPGFGDFQVEKIEKIPKGRHYQSMEIDNNDVYLPNEEQESLEELNPEEIAMEEDEDFYGDDENGLGVRMDGKAYFDDDGSRKALENKKLPRGTSEYQGRWLLEDVLENASDLESDDEEVDGVLHQQTEEDDVMAEPEGTEYAPTEFTEMHVELSPEEEERQLAQYRDIAKDDLEYPDELELHPSESGKERLAAFRGIKSLYNCDWDYDEADIESPSIWNRLLRISNFKATKNRVAKEAIKQAQISSGEKARIYIKAPEFLLERINCSRAPFAIYELLQHEHKLAVCNFSFESWEDYEEPVPSKESIVVQYGPRRQVIQPTFNQPTNNPNNVHKYENFVHPGNTSIATAIAPVLFNNAPAIYFKPSTDGGVEFIGTGTFLNCDHTRITAQRAVLTGHAVKIHKRVVTVRYMFFNPEDIQWFKAVPLFTKSGRSGFIKESLGTHGYFKAQFDGKLSSQDVVAMSLYKRVWPDVSSAWTE